MNNKFIVFVLIILFSNYGCNNNNDNPKIETVKIGKQIWMKKNLEVDHYRNGDSIPEVKDQKKWACLKTGAWCYFDNNSGNNKIIGKLYNFYAVIDSRGLAPKGWHIPSEDEWIVLETYLGGRNINGGKIKEIGTEHWRSPNKEATNTSGFTALPGGWRTNDSNSFGKVGGYAYFWTSTVASYNRELSICKLVHYFYGSSIYPEVRSKGYGLSVRCIKD